MRNLISQATKTIALLTALGGCGTPLVPADAMPNTGDMRAADTSADGPLALDTPKWLQLSGNVEVNAVAESGGSFFIATDAGLVEQTAAGVVRFLTPANSELPEAPVLALVSDASGGIWMSGRNGVSHLANGVWKHTSFDKRFGSDWVTRLTLDSSEQLFVATSDRVARLQGNAWIDIESEYGIITGMQSSDDGSVWVSSKPRQVGGWFSLEPEYEGGGLHHISNDSAFRHVADGSDLPSDWIKSMAVAGPNEVYLLFSHEGTMPQPMPPTPETTSVIRFDGWTATTVGSPLEQNKVSSLATDAAGDLFAQTSQETLKLNGDAWEATVPLPSVHSKLHLVDSAGRAWVSGFAGEQDHRVLLHRHQNSAWVAQQTANSNLPSTSIRAMVIDQNDVVWLATGDQGLLRYLPDDKTWQRYPQSEPAFDDDIEALAVDPQNRVIVFNRSEQLIRLSDGALPEIWPMPTTHFLPRVTLNADCDGHIWIGMVKGANGGLWHHTQNSWEFFGVDDLPNHSVVSVDCDNSRGVWVGTLSGNAASLVNGAWTHYSEEQPGAPGKFTKAVQIDGAGGGVWVGHLSVFDGGLSFYNGNGWWAADLSAFGEAPNVGATLIAPNPAGGVFFVANTALGQIDAVSQKATPVSPSLPLAHAVAIATDKRGNTWVATRSGLSVFNADGVRGLDHYVLKQAGE